MMPKRKSKTPVQKTSEYKQSTYIPEEDDEIDDEIVRRNTKSQQQRANLEKFDGTDRDVRMNKFHKNRATNQVLPPPMITLQPADDSEEVTNLINVPSKVKVNNFGLSPAGNLLISRDESGALKKENDKDSKDDKKDEKASSSSAKDNETSVTKPKTAYQRFDTSKFKQMAKKQIVKQQIVGAVRNVLGVKDNNFLREQMIEREKLTINPMIRTTMSAEIKPIMDKIAISYRKYYPDKANEKGYQLGTQAQARAKELAKINEATTIKPQTHFQRMLYGDRINGSSYESNYSGDDSDLQEDDFDDDPITGRMNARNRNASRTSMLSRVMSNNRANSVFNNIFHRGSIAVRSKMSFFNSNNKKKTTSRTSLGKTGRSSKKQNFIRSERPFENIRKQLRNQKTNQIFAGNRRQNEFN